MSAGTIERAEDIFYRLLDLDGPEREAALVVTCAGDERLIAEVRSLLAAHRGSGEFLDTDRARSLARESETRPLPPGSRIAGYTIQGVLGIGGMGVVYVAEQDRPRRTVALKLIRRANSGPATLRRFENEAEALGRLQHPGIAQIFEAGAAALDEPTPFIAMELVRGRTLLREAEVRGLTATGRIAVVASVCDAVQHAHERGVIHRDLKPGNILVDERGQPKVLDFGVARAAGADLSGASLHTGIGQLIGTLQYMSPEQVRADPQQIDGRSDVYALGVILYELLAGRPPYDVAERPLLDAARIICEGGAPRLGSLDRTLRGDAETIVAKALEPEKERRYASAADLADDLRAFLDGRPIAARDDSALYALRKRVRRYKGIVAVAGASAAALAVLAAVALTQAGRNERLARSEEKSKSSALEALRIASKARAEADATSDRLRDELRHSTVEQARSLGQSGNLRGAEDLLWPEFIRQPASTEVRWALWELYARFPSFARIPAHDGVVYAVQISPDGARLYSASEDGTLKMWDADTRANLGVHSPHGGPVRDISLSADGALLTSAGGGAVILWDALTLTERRTFPCRESDAWTSCLSPDHARLAAGFDNGTVVVWEAATGAELARIAASRQRITRVCFSPDGSLLAAAGNDGVVRIWRDPASPATILTEKSGPTIALNFSPDGTMIAGGGADRVVHLWDVASGASLGTLASPNGTIRTVAFTADGKTLLSSGWWSTDLWDLRTRTRRRSFPEGATMAAITPDGTRIIGAAVNSIRVWDVSAEGVAHYDAGSGRLGACLSPDGRMIASGDEKGVVSILLASSGRVLTRLGPLGSRARTVRFSPDGEMLGVLTDDRILRIFDLASGMGMVRYNTIDSPSSSGFAFSPDSGSVAFGTQAGQFEEREIMTGRLLRTFATSDVEPVGVRYSPDGAWIAATTRAKFVRLCPPGEAEPRMLQGSLATVWTSAFSPDSRTLASGTWGQRIELWDVATGTRAEPMQGHNGTVWSVEFAPNPPGLLASGAADGLVKLWDTASHRCLASLDGLGGWDAINVDFTPDGRRLLAGGANGEVCLWDLWWPDRLIAGNVEFQLAARAEAIGAAAHPEEVRRWAHEVQERSATAHPPEARGVDPAAIAIWGAKRRRP